MANVVKISLQQYYKYLIKQQANYNVSLDLLSHFNSILRLRPNRVFNPRTKVRKRTNFRFLSGITS